MEPRIKHTSGTRTQEISYFRSLHECTHTVSVLSCWAAFAKCRGDEIVPCRCRERRPCVSRVSVLQALPRKRRGRKQPGCLCYLPALWNEAAGGVAGPRPRGPSAAGSQTARAARPRHTPHARPRGPRAPNAQRSVLVLFLILGILRLCDSALGSLSNEIHMQ